MQTENFTLGKKELLILLGLTLVLPFPINWALIELNPLTLMAGADDVPTWIGFGGSYIGGIIGGVISIMILNKTLQQTGVLHHDLKLLQLDTIIYTQQQDWFTGFKQELAENLKSIDLYVLNTVVSSISMKNYAYAKEVLTEINKGLEYQMVAASFSFTSTHLSSEEKKYMNLVRRVQTEYSSFIKDILYYIPLAETISSRKKLNYDQLEVRKSARSTIPESLVLVTVVPMYSSQPDKNHSQMKDSMHTLERALRKCLRVGDVAAKYSDSQYIVLLSKCSCDTASDVMKRIIDRFNHTCDTHSNMTIQFDIEPVSCYSSFVSDK